MKSFSYISPSSIALILVLCFFQCASTKELEKEPPTEFEDVYYQRWNAGIEEGGSGINVFIKTIDTSVALDSIYFLGKGAQLHVDPKNASLYVGRFKYRPDLSNEATVINSDIPFKLNDDECIISYFEGKKIHYYKISNIEEREPIHYPSTSPNRQF